MIKTIQQIDKGIKKLEKQKENKLKELDNQDFIEIKCKKLNKVFRIYKWENKVFKDFPMPKGFNWAEHSDFVYLYDNDLIKLEKYPVYYYVKNYSKKNIKKEWALSRLYLCGSLIVYSYDDHLAYSSDDGRVVISK